MTPAVGGISLAIVLFVAVVVVTLGVTAWAARRTNTKDQFYAAGGRLTGLQNGLAIAGDFMSAGAFLGLAGLVYARGFDGLVYAVGYTTGLPIVVFLLTSRLRKLGRFTFTDAVSYRLEQAPVRIFSAAATLVIVLIYLIAQMVGAGQLIELLFGIDYLWAELLVGGLMVSYVMFGGMVATSWVQIVKAVLLLVGGALITTLVLARFGFDADALLAQAVQRHPAGAAVLAPRQLAADPLSGLSLALALMFGTAGLPHILMRFFTVPDARTARTSVLWATVFMNGFFAMVFVIGFGAIALVSGEPQYQTAAGALRGGGNMAAIHLAHAVGGEVLLGFISAVAFATILAVVSGLTMAGAAAVSHDLYASLRRGRPDEKRELRVSRAATLGIGLASVLLGLAFKSQNVAYLVSLAFAVASSSTFPVLLLALYWRGLTTAGAVVGGALGLIAAVGLTVVGPTVWVTVLGHASPLVRLDPPTLLTLPLALCTCWLVSVLDRSARGAQDRRGFAAQSRALAD